MAKERLSKIQKDILVILYTEGKTTDRNVESVSKKDRGKMAELKKQGYQSGGLGGPFGTGEEIDDPLISGNIIYTKEVAIYELSRLALLFKVYNWEKYNAYKEGYYGFGRWRGRPEDYNKKQVILTKSLRNLCGKRLIDLMSKWGGISIYNKELADKLEIEPSDFEADKRKGMERERQLYAEEKKENPKIGTFEEWFNGQRISPLGGRSSRRAVWESCNNTRVNRNTKKIRLTDDGLIKVKEIIKAKSGAV